MEKQSISKKRGADKPLKSKLWERGLADFSARNPLIGFQGKNAVKLLVSDPDAFLKKLNKVGSVKLQGGGSANEKNERASVVYAPLPPDETDALAAKLRRRMRETLEETGAHILFLACGFLRYGEGGEERLAPVVLAPAQLNIAKGKEGFTLSVTGEPFVNATLLEYLYQAFHINAYGIDNPSASVKEILSSLRREVEDMAGWEVTENVYLATFFFQRFLMWNDLKEHFAEFSRNDNLRALVLSQTQKVAPMPAIEAHKSEIGDTEVPPMPEVKPDSAEAAPKPKIAGIPPMSALVPTSEDLILPLPSDASQRAAVAISGSGKSFVLHGPPGTGKSQTITNMIAYALERGKSVLFVAEKKAALEVVGRRLGEIGLGDFCMQLPATDQGEAFKQFRRTLLLQKEEGEEGAGEYLAMRRHLQSEQDALHQKRKLAFSVYEALLNFLARKGQPEVLKIGGDFYDSLDEEKLHQCKVLIHSLTAAAKECGGVFNTPFENVNLTEYSDEVRDRALIAGKALLGEVAHLKCYLALLLDFFKQKASAFTAEKAKRLKRIAGGLLAGEYAQYFKGISPEEFLEFRGANLRLDVSLALYEQHFKILVNIEDELEPLERFVSEGGDYRLNRKAKSLAKRLERAALHPLSGEDIPKYIQTTVNIFSARKQILQSALSKNVTGRNGRIVEKKRQAFLAPLNNLTALAASVFAEFSPERFFEGCIQAMNGCAVPLFEGYLAAESAFSSSMERYLDSTKAERGRTEGEDILGYFAAKAAALLENADLLQARCDYKAAALKLEKEGMKFIGDALESGALSPDDALNSFEKSLYEHFLIHTISSDPYLSRMTSGNSEGEAEKFALSQEQQMLNKRRQIRNALIDRLPKEEEDRQELALLFRLEKGSKRGRLRTLFLQAPQLMKKLCPCLLMSPDAASQYLVPRANEYDIVIFDEASQLTLASAASSLARARQAVIVGDNRQLPPTPFFRMTFSEEDEEGEALESILDEALAAGFDEHSLLWHYRSRHESLVAFSNAMYYENRLNTFPSVAAESRVTLKKVEGVYDRARSKRNRIEAEALVKEVIRRLTDPKLSKKSIGIVTLSMPQREEIERVLSREIAERSLEEVAYGGREPLFVKNLENVQGDERDLILFSVCYGYDGEGKLSYNFGALNREGGWRRLNVACTRAREEMMVFSSISSSDIDASRTSSKGMVGLKAFLEFAKKGTMSRALPQAEAKKTGIGSYLAQEINALGYKAIAGMGMGNFKIDVAVLDPSDKNRFILGILLSGGQSSAADRAALLPRTLRAGGWTLMSVSEVAYFNNPKREVKRIKDCLDALTGRGREGALRYARAYRAVKSTGGKTVAFITDGRCDGEVVERLKAIVAREEPISRSFLKKRCMASFGIMSWGAQAERRLDALIARAAFPVERVGGVEYFYKNLKSLQPEKFRFEGRSRRRKTAEDFTPFETAALIKGLLEEKVTLYDDELVALVSSVYGVSGEGFSAFVAAVVSYGEARGMFRRSVSGRVSLA